MAASYFVRLSCPGSRVLRTPRIPLSSTLLAIALRRSGFVGVDGLLRCRPGTSISSLLVVKGISPAPGSWRAPELDFPGVGGGEGLSRPEYRTSPACPGWFAFVLTVDALPPYVYEPGRAPGAAVDNLAVWNMSSLPGRAGLHRSRHQGLCSPTLSSPPRPAFGICLCRISSGRCAPQVRLRS